MPSEPELHYIPYDAFLAHVRRLARAVEESGTRPDFVVGMGRGGLVPAVYISHELALPMLSIDVSSKEPGFAEELLAKVAEKSAAGTRMLFVDDINDSGGTIESIQTILAGHGCARGDLRFAVVINNVSSRAQVDLWAETIDRASDKRWFVFPWEAVEDRAAIVEEALSVPERLA